MPSSDMKSVERKGRGGGKSKKKKKNHMCAFCL